MHYLTELGAEDQIRLHARSDDFKAISEAHRAKFVKSTRAGLSGLLPVIARKLWVFRYEHPPRDGKTEPEIGHGMVGSVTFARFGESTPNLSAEQVYGLHCAWDGEEARRTCSPEARVKLGIPILYNPGFGRG